MTAAALALVALWPGGLQGYLPGLLGPSTALVDANLEMWRFFQRFTLDAVPAK